MTQAEPHVAPESPEGGDWSTPSGDLLMAPGDILGIRLRQEHVGGPFVALLVEIPSGIRPYFKLVDVAIGERSVVEPPHAVDPAVLHFGQWIELSGDVSDHILLAVMCLVGRRSGTRAVAQRRLRGVIWLRDRSGRLWGESVGWVGPQAVEAFSAWCSR